MADWRKNLTDFFESSEEAEQQEERPEFDQFISDVVIPAFEEILPELEAHGRTVTVRSASSTAVLIVHNAGDEELMYRIQPRTFPNGVLPFAEIRFRERKGLRRITVESMFRSGTPDYRVSDITKDEIIENFVENYTKRVRS